MPFLQPYQEGLLVATKDRLTYFNSNAHFVAEFSSGNKIVSIAASPASGLIALATNTKALWILDEQLKEVKQLTVNRNVSQLHFSNELLLVADKSGDVYTYDIRKDDSKGDLLLGHNSMILDITTSKCEKYVFTSDRDEKIRISCFPNAYNIAMYCLGHTEFVTRIKVLKNNKTLVSSSGDGTVRFWDFLEGTQLFKVDTSNLVNKDDLEQFFSTLEDVEKCNALPVTNMDIYESKNDLFLILSLGNMQKTFLYKINQENFNCELVSSFKSNPSFSCFYKGCLLYVENSKICCYNLSTENSLVSQEFLDNLNNSDSVNLNVEPCLNIQGFYKRTFDNLKEYHETKKQRITTE